MTLVGDSTGGGMVQTKVVNGYPLQLQGDCYAVLMYDRRVTLPSVEVEAAACQLIGYLSTDIVQAEDTGRLYCIRLAEMPDLTGLKGQFDLPVDLLQPVLPVLAWLGRQPQLFDTMTRWRKLAAERGLPLSEVAVKYEMAASGWGRERVLDTMRLVAAKMHRQTHAAYEPGTIVPESPFKTNLAALWAQRQASPDRLTDDLTAETLRWAFGAGAGIPGVETVPGPMGSGGGYIYAALHAVQQRKGFTDDDLLRGLFIAAGIGAIAYTRTEPTGEVTGCTGECGICGAMAAAAVAEMAGGTPEQIENAASLSLQAAMGWPCDPIAGGLGQPCRSRILSATCTAVVFADLALAGRDAVLPLHEAIDVADKIGRRLGSDLLCTGRGGASIAPAALRWGAVYRTWIDATAQTGTPRPPGNLI